VSRARFDLLESSWAIRFGLVHARAICLIPAAFGLDPVLARRVHKASANARSEGSSHGHGSAIGPDRR
jgi:hypothetical protein